jgi:hypothetical protein
MQFQRNHFSGVCRIDMVDFLLQMTVIRHAGFTLFFVAGGQPKAPFAATAHGFHNGGDHDLPVARRMA